MATMHAVAESSARLPPARVPCVRVTGVRVQEDFAAAIVARTPLPDGGRFTVFAPNDAAFTAAAANFGGSLPNDQEFFSEVRRGTLLDLLAAQHQSTRWVMCMSKWMRVCDGAT